MKPAPFHYVSASSVDEATSLLAEHGEDSSVLAGGQSLVPLMNLRLARPEIVVDIGRIEALTGIRRAGAGGDLTIGATTRHAAALSSGEVAHTAPLMAEALRYVAHPAIRAQGTLGGSLAHADPAAELPAVVIALDADVTARSGNGVRTIQAGELFAGPFTTTLGVDELLTEIRIPGSNAGRSYGFSELARRHGDFAIAGACCTAAVENGTIRDARIVLFGVGSQPVRALEAEAALEGAEVGSSEAISAAAAAAAVACDPTSDVHASASYRRRMAAVVTRRALERLGGDHGR